MNLGESTPITTVQNEEIVLTGSDGQTFRMKVADLSEAIRQVMPEVSVESNGLMSKNGFIYRRRLFSDIDFNNIVDTGYYFNEVGNGINNSHAPESYGVLIVINPIPNSYEYIFQLHIDFIGNLKIRRKWNSWNNWMTVSFL